MPQVPVPQLPERFPLALEQASRDGAVNTDARIVNGYVEKAANGEFQVYKRPGFTTFYTGAGAAAGLGMFNWNNDIYSVFGGFLYKNNVVVGAVSNTGDAYSFDSVLGATPRLVLKNGTLAYYYDAGGGLQVMAGTAPPTADVPGWAYLDGTLYYMTPAAAIAGSGINDVNTWDVLNVIKAQIESDFGVALIKHLVYAIALKERSTEVFYDAGNAAGSPLGSVQGALSVYGCLSGTSVQCVEGNLIWLADTKAGGAQVVMMQGLKVVVISTKVIEKILLEQNVFTTVYSWSLKASGHTFYVLTLVERNLTLVYDLRENMWYQWTDSNGNYLPFTSSSFSGTSSLVQHESDGNTYHIHPDYTTDAGQPISFDLYTPNFDAGVDKKKMLNVMRLNCDRQAGSTMTVRSNDFDYDPTKWSNPRTFDLSQQRPMLVNCGSFYRRALRLSHTDDTKLRISSLDLQMSLGLT